MTIRKSRNRNRNSASAGASAADVQKRFMKDSFTNFATALGVGTNNASSVSGYSLNPKTRNRAELEYAYRGSWIVGQAVDCPAEDMCREGIELSSNLDQDVQSAVHEEFDNLLIWQRLSECLKWGRLYGGACGYFCIDGADPEQPLNIDAIGRGKFRGILPLDRWQINPVVTQPIMELGPDYGKPEYYDMIIDQTGVAGTFQRIHHSRVVRFIGNEMPFQQRLAEMGWGLSVIERLWDRLIAFDSATQGAAQLIHKAHLRIMKVDGLSTIIAAGGQAMQGLLAQIANMRLTQSLEGITLIDKADEFETASYSFSGLDSVISQLGQQISGALQIPLVRLFGQSPAGLNSTGESDLRTYYDNLSKQQELHLRIAVRKTLELACQSLLGKRLPNTTQFRFKPLWLLTEDQRSQIAERTTSTIRDCFRDKLISRQLALTELHHQSNITGVFTNITQDMIDAAESELDNENGNNVDGDGINPSDSNQITSGNQEANIGNGNGNGDKRESKEPKLAKDTDTDANN